MEKLDDTPTRAQIQTTVEEFQTEMVERGEVVEEKVSDLETECQTRDELDLNCTSDAADEVAGNIDSAREVSSGEFEDESHQLEQTHQDTEECEGELLERSDSTTSDMGKISDASGKVHSDTARAELDSAADAAQHEIEFLDEQEQNAQASRMESERLHQEQEQRANEAKGA